MIASSVISIMGMLISFPVYFFVNARLDSIEKIEICRLSESLWFKILRSEVLNFENINWGMFDSPDYVHLVEVDPWNFVFADYFKRSVVPVFSFRRITQFDDPFAPWKREILAKISFFRTGGGKEALFESERILIFDNSKR